MKAKFIKILLLFFFHVFPVCASVIDISENRHYDISNELSYYPDTSGKMAIEDVTSPNFQDKFSAHLFSYEVTRKNEFPYWVRFTVKNSFKNNLRAWYFEVWNNDIDSLDFFAALKDSGYSKMQAGFLLPFSKRKIYNTNFVFRLDLAPGSQRTYYVRVFRHYPMNLSFHIRSNELLVKHTVTEYWLSGIFYSALIFILLMNVYLFITERRKIYLLYLLLIVSQITYCLSRDGLGFQFIWPEKPWINLYAHHYLAQFIFIFFMLVYSNAFLNLKKTQPLLHKLTIAAIAFKGLALGWSLGFGSISIFPMLLIDSIISLIPLIGGIRSYRSGNNYARMFVLAFAFLVTGLTLTMLNEKGLLPSTIFNWYFINMGLFMQSILIGLALIDQIKLLKDEHAEIHLAAVRQIEENSLIQETIFKELESKVNERTEQLQQMSMEMELKNIELKAMYQRSQELNTLYQTNNEKLKGELENTIKSRVFFDEVKEEDFLRIFPNEESCFHYLSELKWKAGFKCKKCGGTSYSKGKILHGRRCKSCNYDESPTNDTLYHKLKFPIQKAFYLTCLVLKEKDALTLDELSEILSLRRETCWFFKQKILLAKENIQQEENGNKNGWDTLALISLYKNKE